MIDTSLETLALIRAIADPFSSLSHFAGAIVFLALSPILVRRGRGDGLRMTALGLFGVSSALLLAVSGAYHLFPLETTTRAVLMRLDHAAIFVFIACSFTPVHIILFRGFGRWGVLLIVWGFGITALTLKTIYFTELPQHVGLALYLGMGWVGLGTGVVLWRRLGFQCIEPLVWGGVSYSVGAIIDSLQWPVLIPGVIQWHEVFHVAVLLGIALHWSFVYAIADGRLQVS